MDQNIKTYRDLLVWQKSTNLVLNIYALTENFPQTEVYGLTSQMRRAAISIPSNIAEGFRRGSKKDYRHFLITAFGSGAELETQIIIARQLPFGQKLDFTKVDTILEEVMKMLNSLIQRLNTD